MVVGALQAKGTTTFADSFWGSQREGHTTDLSFIWRILGTFHGRGKTANTVTPMPYRSLSDSFSCRSLYTFQLISDKRSPTSGILPPRVEGGRRPFARRNITHLEIAWSYELTLSCEENVPDFNLVAGLVSIMDNLILRRSGSCRFLSTGTYFEFS